MNFVINMFRGLITYMYESINLQGYIFIVFVNDIRKCVFALNMYGIYYLINYNNIHNLLLK